MKKSGAIAIIIITTVLLSTLLNRIVRNERGQISKNQTNYQELLPQKIMHGSYVLKLPPGFNVNKLTKDDFFDDPELLDDSTLELFGIKNIEGSTFKATKTDDFGYFIWLHLTEDAEYDLLAGTKGSVINGVTTLGCSVENLEYNSIVLFDNEAVEVMGKCNLKGISMNVIARYLIDNTSYDYRQVAGIIVISRNLISGSEILNNLKVFRGIEDLKEMLDDW